MTPAATVTNAPNQPNPRESMDCKRRIAFNREIERNRGRMLAVAMRIVRNRETAEDAVQDALLSAWRALPEFSERAELSTWLHRIVINAALMRLRAQRREQAVTESALGVEKTLEPSIWIDRGSAAVLDRLAADERDAVVRNAVRSLPAAHREVVRLRELAGASTSETAGELGISESAVKLRLHRARRALRPRLAKAV
ncbi:MAG: RNA polymerase sigma factor [Phycisphaerae bacterium]